MKRELTCTLLLLFSLCIAPLRAQNWVDETLDKLSLEQKIAQLITIRSFAAGDSAYFAKIAESVAKYQVGGVCFFKGNPHAYVRAQNLYQSVSLIPLLISIDGEWGVAMRLDSVQAFPRQQTLGAMTTDDEVFRMGETVAQQCKRLGIHLNFIPCVDVNSNPKNPVINTRSFGESPVNVANKGIAYAQGLQSQQVLGSAKHFPGHGDTDVDSHHDLPIIRHSTQRLDSVELFPFKYLIKNGVFSVMVAHLSIPQWDTSSFPSSVSPRIVDTLLRQQLGFKGMIFTDGLEMNAFAKYGSNGEMELRALMAGVDHLLLPVDTEKTIKTIAEAVRAGKLSEESVHEKCRKVLQAKYELGLHLQKNKVSEQNLLIDLNKPAYRELNKEIYSQALTVLENKDDLLPIQADKYQKVILLNIGDSLPNVHQKILSQYVSAQSYNVPRVFSEKNADSLAALFADADLILLSQSNTNMLAQRNYGLTPSSISLIKRLSKLPSKMAFVLFASPYALSSFVDSLDCEAILVAYQEQNEAQEIAAHALFGAANALGRLPVTVSQKYPLWAGKPLKKQRLSLSPLPQTHDHHWNKVDALVEEAIQEEMFPGCQLLVAQKGQIIYHKAFGKHTYEDSLAVTINDLYDIASVTKVAATSLALMKLYDEKRFLLDEALSEYLDDLKHTNKAKISIRQVLAHQAGLQASVATHRKNNVVDEQEHDYVVADGLYATAHTQRLLHKEVLASALLPQKYLYSDLGFYLLADLVETLAEMPLDQYLQENFYEPMGLKTIGYKPRERFPLSSIVPTERDTIFRKQLIHGYVHDPTVAIQGGVGGAAGLFSNAEDLAILFQMLLNKGVYNGKTYLSPETVELFTQTIIPGNRRGAGFDKPLNSEIPQLSGPAAPSASPASFGHSGFTGTYVWADPANEMIYVFLSNRVYPSADNNKLARSNFRTRLQEEIYQLLK